MKQAWLLGTLLGFLVFAVLAGLGVKADAEEYAADRASHFGRIVPAVRVVRDVPAHTPLTLDDLEVGAVTRDNPSRQAFIVFPEDAVGRIAAYPLLEGDLLLAGRLVGGDPKGWGDAGERLTMAVPLAPEVELPSYQRDDRVTLVAGEASWSGLVVVDVLSDTLELLVTREQAQQIAVALPGPFEASVE